MLWGVGGLPIQLGGSLAASRLLFRTASPNEDTAANAKSMIIQAPISARNVQLAHFFQNLYVCTRGFGLKNCISTQRTLHMHAYEYI